MLVSTVWLGTIGFIDDYIKVYKKDKEGLLVGLNFRSGWYRINCWVSNGFSF